MKNFQTKFERRCSYKIVLINRKEYVLKCSLVPCAGIVLTEVWSKFLRILSFDALINLFLWNKCSLFYRVPLTSCTFGWGRHQWWCYGVLVCTDSSWRVFRRHDGVRCRTACVTTCRNNVTVLLMLTSGRADCWWSTGTAARTPKDEIKWIRANCIPKSLDECCLSWDKQWLICIHRWKEWWDV